MLKNKAKECSICERMFPLNTDYYTTRNASSDGFTAACRECRGFKFTRLLDVDEGNKRCTTCDNEFLIHLDNFKRRKGSLDGFSNKCRKCTEEYNTEYHNRNKVSLAEYKQNYYKNNKKTIKIKRKKYYNKNKKTSQERQRKYYQENKDKIIRYQRKYRNKNPDYVIKNTQERRARASKLPYTLTTKQWNFIKSTFNNECAYCGLSESEHLKKTNTKLHQDHFVALSKGGGYTAENIIPACKSCNSHKSNADFFEWYPTHKHYSKEREDFIVGHLKTDIKTEQLSFF